MEVFEAAKNVLVADTGATTEVCALVVVRTDPESVTATSASRGPAVVAVVEWATAYGVCGMVVAAGEVIKDELSGKSPRSGFILYASNKKANTL